MVISPLILGTESGLLHIVENVGCRDPQTMTVS